MKILILCKKFPYPPREGEPIAIANLSKSLVARGCEVSILVLNTSKHYFDPSRLPANHNHYSKIYSVPVNNHITILGAIRSLVKGESYILGRFYSKAYEEQLKSLLLTESFDIIQLETVYMAHYIPAIRQHSTAVIAMRAHNVEHGIWQRVAEQTSNPFKRWYLKNQNRYLKRFEQQALAEYDLLLAITDKDLEAFEKMGYDKAAIAAPVGLELDEYEPDFQCFEQYPSIAFIGALDWMPNQDGLVWFLEKVWPPLSNRYPNLEFHIAGKNTPDWLRKKSAANVIFHGEVPDAKAFINQHPLFVAPLHSGSGIKIKILEGMALARAVFTTPVGAEGIAASYGKEFFLAVTAEEFIDQLSQAMENRHGLTEVGLAARAFIKAGFDNLEIADRVVAAYKKSVQRKLTA